MPRRPWPPPSPVLAAGRVHRLARRPSRSRPRPPRRPRRASALGDPAHRPRPSYPAHRGAQACYRLTAAQLTKPTNASTPVPCRSAAHRPDDLRRHAGHRRRRPLGRRRLGDRAEAAVARTCPRKLAAYVGGSATARDLSRFNVVWYSPTLEQSDQGADWFRCDLIAFAGQDQLAPLPATRRGSSGVLGSAGALDELRPVRHRRPPARAGFQRVICGARPLLAGRSTRSACPAARATPARPTVRKAGDADCKDLAQARAGNALKFRYGWEWPTRDAVGPRPAVRLLLGPRAEPGSEAELAQLLGVALPVLGDLHVQVEVDRGAQQRLDLLAGLRADVLQPRALVADDDALLRRTARRRGSRGCPAAAGPPGGPRAAPSPPPPPRSSAAARRGRPPARPRGSARRRSPPRARRSGRPPGRAPGPPAAARPAGRRAARPGRRTSRRPARSPAHSMSISSPSAAIASRCSPSASGVDEVGLGDDRELRRTPDLAELLDDEPVAGADLLVGREADRDHVDLGPGGASPGR